MAFKTIIVALSNSHSDLDLVIQALTEFNLTSKTRVILSHVVATEKSDLDLKADRPQPEGKNISVGEFEKQLKVYREKLPCFTEVEVVTGDPSEEIVRLSNIYNADLIVIGSRGLKGINRILQKSISSQVVAEANCSVFVVKQR
ncbi:MAG: universal stress protein [Okeania sp. SIO3B5]|uniref:universal stress protein n=1 Tax=Okeania sp. SIO3B5 TaxID=2607811 RepID=UPI0013FE5409|nr:universal stress protein [Okeania sp. SIO3B5]NEO57678.1 universal stress protein [Okeania sp. SIO3B5]